MIVERADMKGLIRLDVSFRWQIVNFLELMDSFWQWEGFHSACFQVRELSLTTYSTYFVKEQYFLSFLLAARYGFRDETKGISETLALRFSSRLLRTESLSGSENRNTDA